MNASEAKQILTASHISLLGVHPGAALRLSEASNGYGELRPEDAKPVSKILLRSYAQEFDAVNERYFDLVGLGYQLTDPAIAEYCEPSATRPAAGWRRRLPTDDAFLQLARQRRMRRGQNAQRNAIAELLADRESGALSPGAADRTIELIRHQADAYPEVSDVIRRLLDGGDRASPPED